MQSIHPSILWGYVMPGSEQEMGVSVCLDLLLVNVLLSVSLEMKTPSCNPMHLSSHLQKEV